MKTETTKPSFSLRMKEYFAAKRLFTAKNIAYLAVLLALVVVLQLFASAIAIGPVQLNFSLLPIVLGAILLGPVAGGILGLVCGIIVVISVITGQAPFYVAIWTNSPVVTVFTCILKTTLAGVAGGLLYNLIKRKNALVATFVASGIVPIVNTGLFIVGCLCMTGTIADFGGGLKGIEVLTFILVGLVSFNFFIEFAINLFFAPALYRVVTIAEKQIAKQRKKSFPEAEQKTESENETESDGEVAEPLGAEDTQGNI